MSQRRTPSPDAGSAADAMQMSLPWFEDEAPAARAAPAAPMAARPVAPAAPADPGVPTPKSGATIPAATAPSAVPAGAHAAHPPAVALSFRHPHAEREIRLGDVHIAYAFKRVSRRSIGMVVDEHGLSVRAPRWVGHGEIEAALREKAKWICSKLADQRERARRNEAARIDWRDGTGVPFLGETVILVLDTRVTGSILHTDAQALPGVPRLTLHVGLPQTATPDQIRDAVQSWLQRQARRIFQERCEHYAARLGVRMTRLVLSSAQTRWGSASADGVIRLNWRLVHFGMATIDYVAAHELAHLREMNHGPRFWDVVRSVIPDVDGVRQRLRNEVVPDLGD